jgi:hypothetical protein
MPPPPPPPPPSCASLHLLSSKPTHRSCLLEGGTGPSQQAPLFGSFPCQMQPLLPQLVSHRSNGAHPHSLRRVAASSVVLALLLVASVALSSSSVSSSLEAHVDALPTDAQMKSAEAPASQASPASHASHPKRRATPCNPIQSHKNLTAFVLFSDEQRPNTIAPPPIATVSHATSSSQAVAQNDHVRRQRVRERVQRPWQHREEEPRGLRQNHDGNDKEIR